MESVGKDVGDSHRGDVQPAAIASVRTILVEVVIADRDAVHIEDMGAGAAAAVIVVNLVAADRTAAAMFQVQASAIAAGVGVDVVALDGGVGAPEK
jgi:hypothetical protein